jgi:molecular chaperone GrpE
LVASPNPSLAERLGSFRVILARPARHRFRPMKNFSKQGLKSRTSTLFKRFKTYIAANSMSEHNDSNPTETTQPQATGNGTDSPAHSESNALEEAQAQLAEAQAKNAELADQYLRAKADTENARRRAEDEIAKSRKFAVEGFAESMLPVIDSLEAGLAVQEATLEQIREGAQATLRQLLSALERNKVVAINPAAGDKFDPNQHQAISMVPSEQEANTVVAVLQKGYLIAERVMRPALVTVAAPK